MALGTWETVNRPNRQNDNPANEHALVIQEFTGIVEGTIARKSVVEPWIPMRKVTGTATVTNYAVGESQLGKVQPGEAPKSTVNKFSRNALTIDTTVYARNAFMNLEIFQTNFDARKQVGEEQGKKIAKFRDQSFLIQAAKAAQLTTSPFGDTDGHTGGTTYTLGAAADRSDPSKLYYALGRILEGMEEKDVDPLTDDVAIFLRPAEYYTLLDAEQLTSGEFITSDGNSIKSKILSAYGVPVFSTNNLPSGVVTDHLLGTDYNGDFSKLVAVAFSPRALLAGETISLTSDVWYDKMYKQWFVDSEMAYGVTPKRPEFAAAILTP